jgi:hypothetical protein
MLTMLAGVILTKGDWCELSTKTMVRQPEKRQGAVLFGCRWQCRERCGLGSLIAGYRVRIGGEWHDVPDNAVITAPNLYGRTMVWPIRAWGGVTTIRCFMPGPMS